MITLTLNQFSALEELINKTEMNDAADPALEIAQQANGMVVVSKRRQQSNLVDSEFLGYVAQNGMIFVGKGLV